MREEARSLASTGKSLQSDIRLSANLLVSRRLHVKINQLLQFPCAINGHPSSRARQISSKQRDQQTDESRKNVDDISTCLCIVPWPSIRTEAVPNVTTTGKTRCCPSSCFHRIQHQLSPQLCLLKCNRTSLINFIIICKQNERATRATYQKLLLHLSNYYYY